MSEQLLKPKELAERWGVSLNTLAIWRSKGKGAKFVKIGGVRYPIEEVQKFEQERGLNASV
jgi:predicted site-specific integrase-resolvase